MARRCLSVALIAAALIAVSCRIAPALASDITGVPDGGMLNFAILRNGEAIGSHVIRFERNGSDLEVRIEAKVDYRFGFIPLYRFEHQALEVWRDGSLQRMAATTNDNGAPYQIALHREEGGMVLAINGVETAEDPDLQPASLWSVAIVTQRRILDPADGELMSVEIADAGMESIRVAGRDIQARHYVMTGDFERDLWYDSRGVLMQVRFHGDDGSEIRYDLR
ncbi:MAG: DUF6134 family protein [Alphaproteobacteria bacterium]